ncbi:cyclase family protein [Leucobacter sp. W1153]|uniref:cyclase family protein n=1 Tax=Leucobacter sp. W1153 TaxID=3439064 RepID=UPI003F2F6C9A
MIDLSHVITTGITVYPGDPGVTVSPALTLERDGVAVSEIRCGSHTGTHVDAPAHTVAGGRTMDAVRLEELVGTALVIDAAVDGGLSDFEPLSAERLRLGRWPSVPAIVLIRTGWDQHFGTDRYLRHPFLTRDAAATLLERGMRVLGVDTLNPDRTPASAEDLDFAVHESVLGSDGLIIENLRGLAELGETAHVGFFPMRLGGADGAPVRAVAFN